MDEVTGQVASSDTLDFGEVIHCRETELKNSSKT